MAEAIVAFGVAANVVQFIDVAARVAVKFYGFYSDSNADGDWPEVESINRDLLGVLQELRETSGSPTIGQTGLEQLAQECQKTADQLDKVLQPLITVRSQNIGKRAALKAAFKAMWKESEIESLKGKLDLFRSQLTLHLLTSLR
jgi:hypothetical protein